MTPKKKAKQSKKVGRPPIYAAEHPAQAYKLALLGATDADVAAFFNVSESTIDKWKVAHPEFLRSLKSGKAEADATVAKSLFRKANGWKHRATKITVHAESGMTTETPYIEKFAGDTTAQIFWLKNRRPDLWRDKQSVEHSADESLASLLVTAGSK